MQKIPDHYLDRFERDGSAQRFFFACHNADRTLTLSPGPARHLWTGSTLATVAVRCGLFDWLIERTR